MKYKIIFLTALLLIHFQSGAQELLTLEEAVQTALENNYDIRLSENILEITKNNVSPANAGMLPQADGNLSTNASIQNSSQTRSTGEVRELNNAKSSNLNYGVGLQWTIFDGMGMFVRYDRLKELQKLSEADMQLTILSRVSDVIRTYFNLVQQQLQLDAADTAIVISRLRLETAQNRFEIGKASRLEVLNAQVDLNTDTTSLLRQQELYNTTKIALNTLLARDVNTPFRVSAAILIDESLNLEHLTALAEKQNPSLQAALVSKRIAELSLKEVKAERFPTIGLNSGYNFNRSESALGFATSSRGRGFTYGLTASLNIFNGFLQRKNERNAAIEIENAQLDYERLNQAVRSELAAAYQTYITNLALAGLEKKNQQIAKRNLDITLEKFRLGSISPVEFREAQRNYVDASVRYANAQYQAKISEVSLKELAGNINLP